MRWLVVASVIALGACGANELRPKFDGIDFRTKVSTVDKQRDQIAVAVSGASQSLDGAREAGRYAAVKYCIKQYGSSQILWANGPDAETGALSIVDDTLQLRGKCTA